MADNNVFKHNYSSQLKTNYIFRICKAREKYNNNGAERADAAGHFLRHIDWWDNWHVDENNLCRAATAARLKGSGAEPQQGYRGQRPLLGGLGDEVPRSWSVFHAKN
jgi:hypothetical protein